MIQLTSLSKSFGDRVLFDSVTWQIGKRERVGLCGPNGAGKTTLLRMLAGLDEPDTGGIVKPVGFSIGYLPQDGLTHSGRTLVAEASLAFQPLLDMRAEMHELEERFTDLTLESEEQARLLTRYSELQDQFRAREGYSIDLRITQVLRGLGFSAEEFERPTETFSGGWQMRIALAKLLLTRPNLLLLDEPTNHLDLDARNWLEEYLIEYPDAVIVVSHDRYFLDAVVTCIADVGLRTLTDYPGSYSHYLQEHDARIERLRDEKRRQDEEVARVKQFIDRFRYQATKAAQVQSRVKMLDKVVPIEVPPERKRVHFTFPSCEKSGRTVLEVRDVSKAYGSNVVFSGVNLHIERGDRLALVGANGNGKSTLMRLLAGVESPDLGSRREGHQVVVQYFAQDEAARLDPSLTVYETLATGSSLQMVPSIRNILGGFLFSGDDVYKKVSVLSGGERTRLAVARMLLRPANTLLLDEPTNHLDIDSKNVLLEALEDFGGTLILVSHDRYFIDRLATRIVDVGGGRAVLYPGTYEEFRWSKAQAVSSNGDSRPSVRIEPTKPAASKSAPKAAPSAAKPSSPLPPKGQTRDTRLRPDPEVRRRARAREALQQKVATLEVLIAERERAVRDLEASMAAPGFYDDHEASKPIIERHKALMWEIGDLMQQWEDLHAQVSAIPH